MLSVMETKPSAYKRQRRREKSKEAARCRRHKETDTFQDICDAVPIPHDIVSQLDRSSTMRVVNSFIKLRHSMTGSNPKPAAIESGVKQEAGCESQIQSDDCVNALNGFVFVLSSDFDLLYISENVKEYLGLSNLDLIGQSLLMFTHEGDHEEIRNVFSKSNQETCGQRKSFIVRIKSTLTVSGKNINLKSATYKVIRCSGVVNKNVEDSTNCLVAHAEVIPHPSNIEHFMDSSTFLTQQTPDMKLTYCDERISSLLGYDEDDLLGKSFYDYCHVLDIKHIEESFKKLYKVGQIETDFYRFLSKFGGYHWVVTQATVISNPRNLTPECVVCIHHVTSNCVEPANVLSVNQCQNTLPATLNPPQCDITKKTLEEIEPFFINDEFTKEKDKDPVPILGSDCSIVMPTFSEMDDTEAEVSMASMYFNSPSIGDPCLFASQQNDDAFEDLFRDVVLENTKKNHLVVPPISNQTNESFNVDQIVEQMPNTNCGPFHSTMSSPQSYTGSPPPLYNNPPSYNNSPQSYQQLPYGSPQSYSPMSGIISPPLSNGVSPCNSPYPSNQYGNDASRVRPMPLQQPMYQRVEVSSGFYNQYTRDLLTGRIDGPKAVPRKRSLPKHPPGGAPAFVDSKKRCYGDDPTGNYPRNPGNTWSNQGYRQSEHYTEKGRLNGDVYDCEFNISDLFQPEMNFSNAKGLTKNLSNPNFLPELSLHDCQVSAPYCGINAGVLPRGVDCVNALDESMGMPLHSAFPS